MSEEIKLTLNAAVEKGYLKWALNLGQLAFDMDGDPQRGGSVQSIGTSAEIIQVGGVWDQGWCLMRNLDETNYVEWGPYDGGSSGTLVVLGRMEPGEPDIFRLSPDVVIGAIANTDACNIDVHVFVN